ncbi:hypothetical protein DPMN_037950 [Dreissena polymorpha]|uniref:Uncharacterized protein n=1 Tax=Dreissena polymorpha TaxID=45954 RepID=A0A9D4RQA7_DREPO|nr:hypothetical protein DPMN_037950 [Dreissena polymorpha]
MPVGVEAYPGNEQVLSFDIDTNPIPIAGVHNQLGLHVSPAITDKISGMYIHMALLLETQPGEQVRGLYLSPSGQLVIKPLQPSKSINTIEAWSDAF